MQYITVWCVLATVLAVNSAIDPCLNYKILNEEWRNVNHGVNNCDYSRQLTTAWYRFTGKAGNKMADSCVAGGKGHRCGAMVSQWLSGGHPRIEDGVVSRTVCGSYSVRCCHSIPSIEVQKCPQGYFVYKLRPQLNCNYEYCGVHDTTDACLSSSCTGNQICAVKNGQAVCLEQQVCGDNQVLDLNGTTCVDVTDTVVLCGENQFKLAVSKNVLPSGIKAETLRLNNVTCRGRQENNFFVFQTSFDACGTEMNFTHSAVEFHNKVSFRSDAYLSNNDVIRTQDMAPDIKVECEYPKETVTWSKFIPSPKKGIISVKGQGKFQTSLQQFRTDQFQQPYTSKDYPLKVALGDQMYFQVKVKTIIHNAVAMLQECKAANSSNPGYPKAYYLVKNGCVVDNTTTVYQSTPNPTAINISFEAFALSHFWNEVYLHCKLLVCDGNDAGSRCQKRCVKQSRKRDSRSHDGVHHHDSASAGPIIVERE